MISAHRQHAAVLLQGFQRRVRVTDVHGVAPAVCMGQPQQQRVEALVEVLGGGHTTAVATPAVKTSRRQTVSEVHRSLSLIHEVSTRSVAGNHDLRSNVTAVVHFAD